MGLTRNAGEDLEESLMAHGKGLMILSWSLRGFARQFRVGRFLDAGGDIGPENAFHTLLLEGSPGMPVLPDGIHV